MNSDSTNEERRHIEHESVMRQRRQGLETEEELFAMQEEFLKSQDRPAATVVRIKPPIIAGSINSTKTTLQDEYDDDMPPPLEKDVVSLNDDESLISPPSVNTSSTKLRGGSRFLQDRANKGPRTHFQSQVGERFEINFDDDESTGNSRSSKSTHLQDDEEDFETEEETRRRLNKAGPSMGQLLNEVLEKPVLEAVAPQAATVIPGSLTPNGPPAKGGFKGKSLFAKRLAEAQNKESNNQSTSSTTSPRSPDSLVSETYKLFMSRANIADSPKKDIVAPTNTAKNDTPLHSVLKKTPDTPHSTLMEQIDDENKRKLASMSQEEIKREQEDLLKNLDPELVKILMKRSSVQRRVSFSEGVRVEDRVVKMHDVRIAHNHTGFQAKRHEEEEGDHPLAMKKKFYADVPAEPEKLEWMGIEGIEEIGDNSKNTPGKSVAPGPQPYMVSNADPPAAHYRFDFSGSIIEGEDTPVHLGLHHHSVDPTKAGYTLSELLHLIRSTVPSQRILPLNIVAKVLQNCRNSNYATFEIRVGILRWLIDILRLPVYIRAALDDKTDSGIVAAVNALCAWTAPQANLGHQDDIWESIDHLNRGYERINHGFRYQSITRFANMELKPDTLQSSQEQGSETEETIAAHAILASKDPVDGLLAMNIIPRLRYLLSVCQLPAITNAQILDILLTMVRTNGGVAKRIFECEGMISTLVREYGAISWPSEKSDIELSCTIKAMSILDVIVRSSKKIASAMIEEGHFEPLLRFLVLTPEAAVENKVGYSIQTQVLKIFRSLAAYGLYCNVLGDSLQSHLLQDLAHAINERSKVDINPIVKSFLSRKLSMLFQLVTAWTHAAADVHRTIPEHSLCWAQVDAFLDPALEAVSRWQTQDQVDMSDIDYVLLRSSIVRYISTWARYLPTNPPDDVHILERVWDVLQLQDCRESTVFEYVREKLTMLVEATPEIIEAPLPHVGITLNNPSSLSPIASRLFEVSLYCEYLSSYLTTMFYIARIASAPSHILKYTIDTLVSETVFGMVEKVTKYELAVQDQIPATMPPWMAFIARHGVYFIAHWLKAMDVLVYQQDPDNSSHIKLTFFPLFQVTALSLLQTVLPGDEFLSNEVLIKNLFNVRVLDKLLSHNAKQAVVVKRILEPIYLQCFVRSEHELKQSQSLWNHDGRGIKSLVVDYGAITGQPLFNWLFRPIDLLFKTKLTYVEESGAMIAATSVAHCTLDFVYSLLQTLDGISFELIYVAILKLLSLEGEKEPLEETEDDGDESEEEDGFVDSEVDSTINKLLDHFSTRGDCSLVHDESTGPTILTENMLSLLTSPLPFSQFMKNFMENSFTTGTLLRYQTTAARLLFPAMALSSELQLLIWHESFNFLGSITTSWEELDNGTLRSLITDSPGFVTSEVLRHYLKAVVSGRVIKQRNSALYWIAIHHLARVAFGPIKIQRPRGGSQSLIALSQEDSNSAEEDIATLEERRSIVKAIVSGTKSEDIIRDWIQYDSRNYEQTSAVSAQSSTFLTLNESSSTISSRLITQTSTLTSRSISIDTTTVNKSVESVSSSSSPVVKSPSRPLSLLSSSASFPVIGSNDYLNCDNILTPPECFRERRQAMITARKNWIATIVDDSALTRIEGVIQVTTPVSQTTPGGGSSIYGGSRWS
ncbi:RNA polymerase II associated protein 1 [Entomortierella beljakovae]|nr:RNA polymerase II associated protein 1 [Entomortierella beljakovae]